MSEHTPNFPEVLSTDPIMSTLLSTIAVNEESAPDTVDLFAEVVRAIIRQQLSVKAARAIEQRFIDILPEGSIDPGTILALETEKIRSCGISYAKIRYITSAAEAARDKSVDFESLPQQSDEQVIAELIKIHGVGRWTAEMILIFSLNRPDVFSVGDLGLRTAVSRLYGVDRDDLEAITAVSSRWSPHRSLACRYLWRSLDNA